MTDTPTNRDSAWLRRALSAIDMVFFDGLLEEHEVTVRWSRWRQVKPGSYFIYATYLEHSIEVNRALAWHWVPDFVVMSTIYHEALHHVVGMEHDLAFRFAEQKFPHYAEAAVWEVENLQKLKEAANPIGRT